MAARKKRPTTKKATAKPKTPKGLGELADKLYAKRTARLKLSAKVEAMKADEVEMQTEVIQMLAKAHLTKASGKKATVSNKPSDMAQVDDWEKFAKWLHRKKDLAVLGRKLGQKHISELREAGQVPDGLKFVSINKLSVTKA